MRTLAGGTEAGDGGRAADASIRVLQGVATDAAGNIYICDADDHRLRRIDPDGRITTLAGNGLPGYSGDGALASQARINTPYGVTVTPVGDIVFADLGNGRVRRILRNGTIETLAGGGAKEIPPAGLFVAPREVKLIAPRNVLATASGSIFISDFGANRVLEIRSDGLLTAMPLGALDLNAPAGMTLDAEGNLLVADSGNARIRRLRRDGRVDIVLANSPRVPLERPVGLARSADGNLLVADTRGDYHWRIDSSGNASILPPGGRDIAVDLFGNIITAGLTWLRRVSPQGLIDILIGGTYSRFRGDGGPALAARLNRPVGVAVDSQGNVYFADTGNHRVRRIGLDGVMTTVAGNGEPAFRGDGGLATQSSLNGPTYLAVDAFDNVYVSDTGNHRVRVFVPGGVIQTVCGTGRSEFSGEGILARLANVSSPMGLAIDRAGALYVAERGQHRIRRIDVAGKIATVAGTSLRGLSVDGQDALLANLNQPGAIALDAQGNLYFADAGNQAVKVVDAASGKIKTIASDVQGPEGLVATPGGVLYWTESQRHRVRQATLAGDVSTVAGRTNENGFNADSGDATALTLNEPAGLALSPDGAFILADRLNDRLRRLDPPTAVIVSNVQSFRIVHAATFAEGPLAPGQLASLVTNDLADPALAEVTFDGMAAGISFASKSQVNFQVPLGIAGKTKTTFELRVGGALKHRSILDVVAAAPAFFETSGLVTAMASDGTMITDAAPARAGVALQLFGTGDGLEHESGGLQVPLLPVSVEIGGVPAEVHYAGMAPGYPGLLQVNLRVPSNIRLLGRVPITLRVGAFQNPRTQMLAVE